MDSLQRFFPEPQKKKPKRIARKILIVLGISLLVLLALAQYGNIVVQRDQDEFMTDQEYLSGMAESITAACPLTYEEGIVLKSMHALPGKTLVYVSSLTEHSVDDLALVPLIRMMKEPLVEQIRTYEEFDRIREMGATLVYRYYDMDGNFIEEVVIEPGDYQ